jgi:signal transduction histidine kinase
MPVQTNQIAELIIINTCVFLLAPAFLLLYISMYNKRKKKHLDEKVNMQQAFSREILQAQLEVQEQTFQNVSQEIHDNIGQVLSFVKLNLATLGGLSAREQETRITESKDLVAQAINDLRDLSKSLSKDHILNLGLTQTVQAEVERISKSGLINVQLRVDGHTLSLGGQRELVLFRIVQESINNTLKHSGAATLNIGLHYSKDLFTLTLSDDGSGFDPVLAEGKNGSGLKNIRNRANLIGAGVKISSEVGKGSEICVSLNPIDNQTYASGNYPGSLS